MVISANSFATQEQKDQLALTLKYIMTSPTAVNIIANSNSIIWFNSDNKDQHYTGTTHVDWDPGSALVVRAADGQTYGVQSAALGLFHELVHNLGFGEDMATSMESLVARELGEPTRVDYGTAFAFTREANSTEHTKNGQWVAFNFNGTTTTLGNYGGEHDISPPNVGSGIAYGGGGSTGDPGGSGPGSPTYGDGGGGDDGGSVYCPGCYVIYPDGTKIPVPVTTLDGIDKHLVAVPDATAHHI